MKEEKKTLNEWLKAQIHPEREPRGDIRPISDRPVMASLYILILMTPAAKPPLSLQQVPLPHSSLKPQDHSTSHYPPPPLGNKDRKWRGWRQRGGKKDIKSGRGVRESVISGKYVFESLSPAETRVDILPPWERDWLLFGVCEKWESEAGQWDSPQWEAERSHLKSVSQGTD